jgi:hypothetical protein
MGGLLSLLITSRLGECHSRRVQLIIGIGYFLSLVTTSINVLPSQS